MKSAVLQTSLLFALAIGTTCGALPVFAGDSITSPALSQPATNPELTQAEQRVTAAESQLELARKQLTAARSLLKAAEADLKAARADKQALSLRQQAQGLAEEAGMRPENNRSLAQTIQSGPHSTTPTTATLTPTSVSTLDNTPVGSAPTPTQGADFNSAAADEPQVAPQLMLR